MLRFLIYSLLLALPFAAHALEITRYVKQGASGDGLTKETPTGNLKKVLDQSVQVDGLTIYLEPGTYALPPLESAQSTQYRNVAIYGGGCDQVTESKEKSIITGDLCINGGAVINVDFKGSVHKDQWSPEVIHGGLHVIGCNVFFTKATHFEAQAVGGQKMWLIGVDAQTASISKFKNGIMADAEVEAWECNFSYGNGASVVDVRLSATRCRFNYNKDAPGLELNVVRGSVIRDCEVIGNRGYGGISIGGLTDDINIEFDRCVISKNITNNHKYSSAITSRVPYFMSSCLIAANSANVNGQGIGYEADAYEAAILLTKRQTRFLNCTFYDNRSALLQYKLSAADHNSIETPQFINCVFLGNAKPFLSSSGLEPTIFSCAADFGSDIPELDKERRLIRITSENAKMKVDDARDVQILPGSPLINVGLHVLFLDLHGNSHQLLGATDMGCCEYTGEWEKCMPESTLQFHAGEYLKVKADYDGTTYYAYVAQQLVKEDKVVEFIHSIYGGREILPLKKIDDTAAISYLRSSQEKFAVVYELTYSPWGYYWDWDMPIAMEYKEQPPVAEKVDGHWILKEPKPKSTSAKTQSSKRTGTGNAKRSTPARRTTTKR